MMLLHNALKTMSAQKSLTQEQAYTVFSQILNEELSETLVAALLLGLRAKGESAEEILGCVQALREKGISLTTEQPLVVDTCGTGGDGANTFNISTAAAFVAAGAGVAIAKHGNRSVSSRCGSADLLEILGIPTDVEPKLAQDALNKLGITFLFAPKFHPALKKLARLRKELGVKTIFNIAGPLANPVRSKRSAHLLGVFEAKLVPVVAEVLKQLGVENGWVVHSKDGLDEISNCDETEVAQLEKGKISLTKFSPELLGFSRGQLQELRGETAAENAAILLAILSGRKGGAREIVVLNAAAACLLGEKATSMKEAVALAENSLDSGKAKQKLEELKKFLVTSDKNEADYAAK